jgi:hypothetical protein
MAAKMAPYQNTAAAPRDKASAYAGHLHLTTLRYSKHQLKQSSAI